MTTIHYTATVAGKKFTGSLEYNRLHAFEVAPRIVREAMRRHVFGVARRRFGVKIDACERQNNIRFRRA